MVSKVDRLGEKQEYSHCHPKSISDGLVQKIHMKKEVVSEWRKKSNSIKAPQPKCFASLTFKDQLKFINVYHKHSAKRGTSALSESGRLFAGKKPFESDYKTKDQRKNVRGRMNGIIRDERRLRWAVACGMGDKSKRWHTGGKYANRAEPKIAKLLHHLKNQNVKIDKRLRNEIALKITAESGIPCAQPSGDDDSFLQKLDEDEAKRIDAIIDKSREHLKKNNKGEVDPNQYIFTPTRKWAVGFNKRWGFEYKANQERGVNMISLLSNLRSALLFVYTMRR
eukprot:323499_1